MIFEKNIDNILNIFVTVLYAMHLNSSHVHVLLIFFARRCRNKNGKTQACFFRDIASLSYLIFPHMKSAFGGKKSTQSRPKLKMSLHFEKRDSPKLQTSYMAAPFKPHPHPTYAYPCPRSSCPSVAFQSSKKPNRPLRAEN